jgi:RNA polymerase sigma-70 factor (ECF subfamily)
LGQLLAECRNYLLLVADREVEPRLQAKVAPSDLVQETMHDALGKFDQFRGRSKAELLTWLTRILKSRYSRAVAHFQYTQKREISREIPLVGSTSSDRPAVEIVAPDMTPGTAAIAHENEQTVRSAMARLPGDYRRVIELRSWQRLSFAQTGKRMNRSAEAARKLWTRAAEKLGIELVNFDDSRRGTS